MRWQCIVLLLFLCMLISRYYISLLIDFTIILSLILLFACVVALTRDPDPFLELISLFEHLHCSAFVA